MQKPEDRPRPATSETAPDPELTGPDLNRPAVRSDRAASLPQVPGYEVLEELGHGGMGIVYKARHRKLKRVVALKMIRAGTDAAESELARFRTEAEAAARLQHPNIVQIYEVGDHDGLPFFSLEFVEGGSLSDRLRERRLPPRKSAELVATLARAMHAAHERDIIHRDLKPANILLAADGTPKISDFGLAKQLDADSEQTRSGVVMGTPSYMAPEQAAGRTRAAGPLCDVYALGAILYECLTGRPPFHGATVLETLEQVRNQDPEPPRRLQPKVPRDLDTICLKCLRKEPEKRYASAEALADDLERFLNDEPIEARPVSRGERTAKWVRKHPATVLAVLVAILVLGGGPAGYWLWQRSQHEQQQREQTDRELQAKMEAEEASKKEETRYYAAFIVRNRELVGIRELTPEQASRRGQSCRFLFRGGRSERVDLVNGSGRLIETNPVGAFLLAQGTPAAGGIASHILHRNEQFIVTGQDDCDRKGAIVTARQYTAPTTIHVLYRGGLGVPGITAVSLFMQYKLSEEGFIKEMWYVDSKNQLRTDATGAYGMRQEYDPSGRILKRTFLGAQGQPFKIADGTAIVTLAYDEQGNQTEETYLDEKGQRTQHVRGFHKKRMRYDEVGNLREEAFFGVDDQPKADTGGIGRRTWEFDSHGNITQEAWFGIDRNPSADRRGVTRWTAHYDDGGNRTEITYLGLDGKPVTVHGGFATARAKFDERDNRIEESYFDAQGKPVLHWNGFHVAKAVFDDHGNRTEDSYFGLDGKLTQTQWGFARRTNRHDERGRIIEEAYFGTDGRPLVNAAGYARQTTRYNNLDKPIEERFFDADNKPTLRKDGYHLVKKSYDENGILDGEAYFGTDEQPTLHEKGYFRSEKKVRLPLQGLVYDGWRYFLDTTDKRPAQHKDGYYFVLTSTDGRGRVTELAYASLTGKTLHKDGYSYWRARHDLPGNLSAVAWFGVDDKPIANAEGYALRTIRTDNHGNRIEEAYFGPDAKPVASRHGYHKLRLKYDRLDQPMESTAFDVADRPLRLQLFVTEVVPGGQGERLGLQVDDVLLTCDGHEVRDLAAFIYQRRQENDPATTKRLTILRGGKTLEMAVSPGLLGVKMDGRVPPAAEAP